MPTRFDQDNLGNSDNALTDDLSSLPVGAQQLYHRLTREGADSRASIARIDQRLQERIAQLSATSLASKPEPEPVVTGNAPQRSPYVEQATRPAPRHPTMRRWVTILATAAVVIAFVAVLAVNAGHRSRGPLAHQTSTGTTSSTTDWVDLTGLDSSSSFTSNEFPAMAPSNPQVVYETLSHGVQQHRPATLRATNDGGATWRKLPTPVPADHIGGANIGISPTNPQHIFLSLVDTTAAECPANRIQSNTEGSGQFCRLQYTSFDGGMHWSMTDLPLAAGSMPGLLTAGISNGMPASFGIPIQSNTLRAQGQRLFAGYICIDDSCNRLVTSDDGGRSWKFADLPLLANGEANVCDYTASASGADLYAVTTATTCDFRDQTTRTLWHSADAGRTWAKVRQLATPNERGIALAQNRAANATLLYMAMPVTTSQATDKMGAHFPVISQSPSDVKVSTDGGATWQSAPKQGIPSDHVAFFGIGLLGPLSDGSIVIDVVPSSSANSVGASNLRGSDLYAWKPGDTSWRLIGSVPTEIDVLLVSPSHTGAGDTIYAFLTTRSVSHTYTVLKKVIVP